MQSKRQFISPFSPLPEHPQQDDPLSLQEYKHTSSYPHATSPHQPQTESPFRAPSIMKSETIPQSTRQGVIPGLKHQFMIPLLPREERTLPLSRQIEATRETLPAPRQEELPLQSSRPPLPRHRPKRKRRGRL